MKKNIRGILTGVFLFAAAFSTVVLAEGESTDSVRLEENKQDKKQVDVTLTLPEDKGEVKTISVKFSVEGSKVEQADFQFVGAIADNKEVVVKEARYKDQMLTVYVSGRAELFVKNELLLGTIVAKDGNGKSVGAKIGVVENSFKVVDGVYALGELNNKPSEVNTGGDQGVPEGPGGGTEKFYLVRGMSTNDSMGIVTVEPQQDSYKEGTEVTLTATAKDGYVFERWMDAGGKDVGKDAVLKMQVKGDVELRANFIAKSEQPTVTPDNQNKPSQNNANNSTTAKPGNKGGAVKTGDQTSLVTVGVLMAAALIGIVVLMIIRRKRSNR